MTDPETRRARVNAGQRASYRRHRERALEYGRRYAERLKNGEIQLPELDWAICERGGTEAQAKAHRRRGERPCSGCLKAETRAALERRARQKRRNAS